DKYVPYSLIDGDQVVANVSVNIMDFLVRGEEKQFIQIGTVMTDEPYRNQGLSKVLIEIVLKEYEEKCDLIYLFANDSVLDFYPKFGFNKSEQYQYAITLPKTEYVSKLKKLNMDHDSDRELVYQLASSTCSYSKLSMINNPSLIMFYATYFMKDNIYYLEEDEVIMLCEFDEDVIYLQELLSIKEISLDTILNKIISDNTQKVVFGFTPNHCGTYEKSLLNEQDTTLFIKQQSNFSFTMEDLMFPILSHA
ncbi:MAG: GNAT family N-acetyltransferase, partial [Turicibacter sp.]